MISFEQRTPTEINKNLGRKVFDLRKRKKMSRQDLAFKSGVSFASLRRFEETGEISLLSFTKIFVALGIEDQIDELLSEIPYSSLEEILNEKN